MFTDISPSASHADFTIARCIAHRGRAGVWGRCCAGHLGSLGRWSRRNIRGWPPRLPWTSRELGTVLGVAILGSLVNGHLTADLTQRLVVLGVPASSNYYISLMWTYYTEAGRIEPLIKN